MASAAILSAQAISSAQTTNYGIKHTRHCCVFVGNISYECTEEFLTQLFSRCGAVQQFRRDFFITCSPRDAVQQFRRDLFLICSCSRDAGRFDCCTRIRGKCLQVVWLGLPSEMASLLRRDRPLLSLLRVVA